MTTTSPLSTDQGHTEAGITTTIATTTPTTTTKSFFGRHKEQVNENEEINADITVLVVAIVSTLEALACVLIIAYARKR